MAVYKLKLIGATTNPKTNAVTLEVKITNDTGYSWNKSYTYTTTQPITLIEFKNRVITDIRSDLKIRSQMDELQAYIGREISITI